MSRTHKQRAEAQEKQIKHYIKQIEMKTQPNLQREYGGFEGMMSIPTKTANSIQKIFTYKEYYGEGLNHYSWVFDDSAVGLVKEPFVAGADTLLDILSQGKESLMLTFAPIPFPGYSITAELVNTVDNGYGGSDYHSPELKHDLWLCPALMKYFLIPPKTIYLQFQ